ncbi:hypothetical protein ACN28C_25675 [Plantactinospora sp. WMMC1484]|uniref:hypothetical protein n=1 Tax=Plantactinospora sp. WMMC1484 TaxID=3404122 RepID=UPI003BF4A61F
MSHPSPDTGSPRKLVWASDQVITQIRRQVQPRISLPRKLAVAGLAPLVLTWVPAFAVFAAMTVAVPSTTDGAGVGRTAFWAVQFAVLHAIASVLTALWQHATSGDTADAEGADSSSPFQIAGYLLLTVVFAGAVLALQGLAINQIVWLTAVLLVVLHLLPVLVARLLGRRRGRGRSGPAQAGPPDGS